MNFFFSFGISRHLLAAAVAILSAIAYAQQAPQANQQPADAPTRTPAIAGVVAVGTPVQFIKQGFKGTEGPLGLPDGGFIFTETLDKRIPASLPMDRPALFWRTATEPTAWV